MRAGALELLCYSVGGFDYQLVVMELRQGGDELTLIFIE
jgi:hypothetical protein